MAAKRDLNTHWVHAVIAEPLQSATHLRVKLDARLQFGNRSTMKFWRHVSQGGNSQVPYTLKGNTTGNLVQWCFFNLTQEKQDLAVSPNIYHRIDPLYET